MAFGLLLPIAPVTGLPDSGHGICVPPTVHSVQPCKTPPIPYSIVIKEWTCWWPPQPLVPLTALNPIKATVLVNGLPAMTFGDQFTPHVSVCTNIVIYMCPCQNGLCPVPTPEPCSILTIEDNAGTGHIRFLFSSTLTVFANKLPVGRVLDPLGIGTPGWMGWSYPCNSVVAYGSPNVLSS
jgi:hypothetical protein